MGQFPYQQLTREEKIKEYGSVEAWGKSVIGSIDGLNPVNFYGYAQNNYEKRTLFNLVEDIIDENDYQHVMQPYGDEVPRYPGNVRNYNLIKPKVRALMGEELKRPFNFRLSAVNREAVSEYEEKRKELLVDTVRGMMLEELAGLGVVPEEQAGEYRTPEQVDKYMKTDFQSIYEIYGNRVISWARQYLEVQDKFNRGFEDLLSVGDEIYYVGNDGKDPILRKVHPLYFSFDQTPSVMYVDQAAWAREVLFMSAPMIYEQLGDILEPEDKEAIENMQGSYAYGTDSMNNGVPYLGNMTDRFSVRPSERLRSTTFVPVYYYTWISRRKYGVVRYYDENGDIQAREVDESYKKRKEDIDIEWDWMNEVWEAFRIGTDLVRGVRPRANQYRGMDNVNKVRIPYTGVSDLTLSIVRQVKHIQYLYNSIWFLLEQQLRRAHGKVLMMDVAQIPSGEGQWGISKFLHYLQNGLVFVNSMEEHKLTGKMPQFNQMTDIDLSLSATIQQYIGILNELKSMVEEITGISRQRLGAIQTSETVGGVERAIQGSYSVTEYLFYIHSNVKARVLSMILEEAKVCWIDGKKTQFFLDDMTRVLMDIDGYAFNTAEYALFVNNSQKEANIASFIESMAQAAVQNGERLKDIVSVMSADSIAEKLAILEKSYAEMQEQAAQNAQSQMQFEAEEKEKDRQFKMEIEDKKIAAELEKAKIQALGFAENKDADANLIPDVFESQKFELQAEKQLGEAETKKRQLDQKDRELDIRQKQVDDAKELAEKEMAIKKKQGTGI